MVPSLCLLSNDQIKYEVHRGTRDVAQILRSSHMCSALKRIKISELVVDVCSRQHIAIVEDKVRVFYAIKSYILY